MKDLLQSRLRALSRTAGVQAAVRLIRETDSRTLQDQVELTLIPAPAFQEEARGKRMAERMREVGLSEVETDAVGNVLGWYRGGASPEALPLLVSAHLDTAFPPDTPIQLRDVHGRLHAPGISDDGRGLAALLALGRSLVSAGLALEAPLLLVATVGEEGVGDLRGVRHLFRSPGGIRARGFISLDGPGTEALVVQGPGARRLRATLRGPGGHSWSDRGVPNPLHRLGAAVAEISRLVPDDSPHTTLTTARWGGGTGVNAVPAEGWLELDLRSEDPRELSRLEGEVRRILSEAARGRLGPRRFQPLELEVAVIGDRPGGRTPPDSPLVQAAEAATRFLSVTPVRATASTDANLPMQLGIPALAMGAGGRGDGAHTLEEWYSNEGGPEGIIRALYTILLVTGDGNPGSARAAD